MQSLLNQHHHSQMQQSNNSFVNQEMLTGFKNVVSQVGGPENGPNSMSALARDNTQMQQVIQYCGGRDPKEVFIQECRNRGVDPQFALNVMSSIGIR